MALAEQILKLAGRTIGVRADEVQGFNYHATCTALIRMCNAGKVHRAKIAHKHVRYFLHAAMRDLFVEQVQLERFEAKRRELRQPLAGNAPWPADAPAIVPEGLKIQYCPSHPPRFQEHVMPFVHGGLRCA